MSCAQLESAEVFEAAADFFDRTGALNASREEPDMETGETAARGFR